MIIRDKEIEKRLFAIIKQEVGKPVLKSPPDKDGEETYILGQRISTTTIDQFRKTLQIRFEVVSSSLPDANDIAADIIDTSNKLYDDLELNLLGDSPELNGMADDSQNGIYIVSFIMQIGYLV